MPQRQAVVTIGGHEYTIDSEKELSDEEAYNLAQQQYESDKTSTGPGSLNRSFAGKAADFGVNAVVGAVKSLGDIPKLAYDLGQDAYSMYQGKTPENSKAMLDALPGTFSRIAAIKDME